jgi:biotin-(acetyl-CoA carboxylase) ligase
MGQSIIQGTIENVDNEGKLCLRLTNGNTQKFAFKEIGFIY